MALATTKSFRRLQAEARAVPVVSERRPVAAEQVEPALRRAREARPVSAGWLAAAEPVETAQRAETAALAGPAELLGWARATTSATYRN